MRRSRTKAGKVRDVAAIVAVPIFAGGSLVAGAGPSSAAPGFTQIYTADFQNSSLDPNVWGIYDNPNGDAHREASNVDVHDGMVSLWTRYDSARQQWSAAGISATHDPALNQTYGKYEMRVRVSAGDSRAVALLWPTGGQWPPEVDFMEMGATGQQATRQLTTQTVHYAPNNQQIHTSYAADMTQWHNVGVEWTPGVIKYTLDGVVQQTVTSTHVPSQDMWLAIQTAAGDTTPTVPVHIDVDWVHIYKYNP